MMSVLNLSEDKLSVFYTGSSTIVEILQIGKICNFDKHTLAIINARILSQALKEKPILSKKETSIKEFALI